MFYVDAEQLQSAGANNMFLGLEALGQNVNNDSVVLTPLSTAAYPRNDTIARRSPLLSPGRARYQLLRNIERDAPQSSVKQEAGRLARDSEQLGRVRFSATVRNFDARRSNVFLSTVARQRPDILERADPRGDLRAAAAPTLIPAHARRQDHMALKRQPVSISLENGAPKLAENLAHNFENRAVRGLEDLLLPAMVGAIAPKPKFGKKKLLAPGFN